MSELDVLVTGADERAVADAAAGLEAAGDVAVQSGTEAGGSPAADCVVWAVADAADLDALDEGDWSVPVVGFGRADGVPVEDALGTELDDFVRSERGEAHPVLAHRVKAAVERRRLATGDAGDGRESALDAGLDAVDAVADGVYALDAAGRITYANAAMASLTGYDRSTLVGMDAATLTGGDPIGLGGRDAADEGRDRTVEIAVHPPDGDPITCEDHARVLVDDDGGVRGVAGVLREVGEGKRRRETITHLQEISRDLMQAPSRESVAGVAADAVRRVLGYDLAVLRLYDRERGTLDPVAATDAVAERLGDRPSYGIDEGLPGQVFASGEPAVYDDVRTADEDAALGPVRAAMYLPVGVHGTLSMYAETVGAFDDVDRQVAALLATNAAAACNRARREQEVRETRERIATILERIEGLVQDTVEVLVEARTREEVEREVCEQLAAADPYVFAWLARPDVRSEALTAREWAGSAAIDVADESIPIAGEAPGARVHDTGESQVLNVAALQGDGSGRGGEAGDREPAELGRLDPEGSWLAAARDAGVASVMAIPLRYTDSSYGVLYVCADREDAFDRREQVVLDALGRAVANAINAIESGRILSANQVIELEFTVEDDDLLFSRLSARTGASVASVGTVTQEDGSLRVYLSATGAECETVHDALAGDPDVGSVTLVAEHEGECLFDVSVTRSLVETLVDHGAVPTGIESERGVVRYAIELPYEAEAREVFSLVEDRYRATDLVGYHEHERPVRTQQEFRASLADRFTERQETALRTAYLGGFFEWPREVDGDELADGMDISRPTYHQHLRAAQQKVFEQLFDPQG